MYTFSREYTRGRGKQRCGILGVPRLVLKSVFQFQRGMFHPYCAWEVEFLGLASLWSTDNRWLGSLQPLRHVARFIAPFTLAEERLPCRCFGCVPWPQCCHSRENKNGEPYFLTTLVHLPTILTPLFQFSMLLLVINSPYYVKRLGDRTHSCFPSFVR